ncbi:MAG: nicotinate-nucleotide adenylyltransferase [Dehalococcoidia bacterium]|nr:nicotinate-nucleotide adenylyltransferase [Dehalococcoidia bacterium]
MEIGLLGGTFDPIHLGHLIIAEAVRERLGLSHITFIPSGYPWLKSDRQITAAKHRLAMVKLAIESNPRFEMSTAEMERSGPSYTVDTVRAIRQEIGPDAKIYFIAGTDALVDLPRWKDPDRVAELCQIVGMRRPSVSEAQLTPLKSALPKIYACIRFVDVPQIDISSSDIRERVRKGLSIRYLVPLGVETYIQEHQLYRN